MRSFLPLQQLWLKDVELMCSCHVEKEESNKSKRFLFQPAIIQRIRHFKMAICKVISYYINSYLALNPQGLKKESLSKSK